MSETTAGIRTVHFEPDMFHVRTPCCGRLIWLLRPDETMTTDSEKVTCPGVQLALALDVTWPTITEDT